MQEDQYPGDVLPPGTRPPSTATAPRPGSDEAKAAESKARLDAEAKAAAQTKAKNAWNPSYLASLQQFVTNPAGPTGLGRTGWHIVGQPIVDSKPAFNSVSQTWEMVESGNYIVTISNGGNPPVIQQFAVQRQDQPGTTGTAGGWNVGPEGIKDVPKDPNADQNPYSSVKVDAASGKAYGINNKTGQWEEIKGHQFTPEQSKYQNVTLGKDGSFYGVDPATSQVVKIPGASVPVGRGQTERVNVNGVWYERGELEAKWAEAAGLPRDVANPEEGTRWLAMGSDGYEYVRIQRNGRPETDTSVPPRPFTPAAQADFDKNSARAKEGDTRPNRTSDGYNIQEVYKNGDWIEDQSVPRSRANPMQPSTVAAPADQQYIYRTDENGNVTLVKNDNYQPEKLGARLQLMQSQAASKRDELQAKIGQNGYTPEMAATEFDTWWNTNIEPYKAQVQQEQQRQQMDDQLKLEQQQNLNVSTAQSGANNQVQNYLATLPYRVGPSFGTGVIENISNAYATGKAPGPIPGDAFTFDAPDLNAMYTNAVAQGLKNISPMAAGIASGRPNPLLAQPIDVNASLNRTAFRPGGTAPAAAAVQPIVVAPGPAASPAASPMQWNGGGGWGAGQVGNWIQQQLAGTGFVPA